MNSGLKYYIAWAPVYVYYSSYLYFDEKTFDFEWQENDFVPKFYLDRDEAESIIAMIKLNGNDCELADVGKLRITEDNGKIIDWNWEEYTKEEIIKYYGLEFL